MKYLLVLCAILFVCCAPAAAERTYQHVSAWECNGIGWGEFSSLPSGVAVDAASNVYVADTNKARILVFDKTGGYKTQWGTLGGGLQQFYAPIDIAVNSAGIVYVSDKTPPGKLTGDRIKRFSPSGRPYPLANNAWSTGAVQSVGGLGIDRSDNVYVADTGNNRILKYTADGAPLGAWGSYGTGNGQFDQPTDVALDSHDRVFVADRNNHRVQIFSLNGEYIGQWSGPSGAPFSGLWGIATDASGNVLVTDEYSTQQASSRAWVFTARDTTLANWDGYELPYAFYGPRGIAADSAGAIYVMNAGAYPRGVEKFVPADGPTLTISGNPSVNEGALYTLNMAATNLGEDTIASWSVDWGDGTKDPVSGNPGSVTHAYADGPNSYMISARATISATATHRELTFQAKSISVIVNNVAPTVGIAGTASVDEGSTYTLTLSATDPGADTIRSWLIDWGDGIKDPVSGNPGSVTHTYADGPNSYTISAATTDEDGTYDAQNTVDVMVANVAPTPSINGVPATSPEGTAITLTSSAVDPGATDTEKGFIYAWSVTKDGTIFENGASGASFTFTPDDNGAYEVTLTSTDRDEGQGTTTAPIAVTNVAPTIEAIDVTGDTVARIVGMVDTQRDYLGPFRADSPISVTVTFSDPGILDTHTPVWDWGDGSVPSEQVGPRVRTLAATHTYTTPGFYTLSITLTDKDGGIGSLATLNPIVVYDPDAGSATGGGWFDSPAGLYTEKPRLAGKAHFAFTTRYKTDATVPDSSVEFQLKPGLDFKGTSVEWLVVEGAEITYRGVGTLNGSGGYGFILTAIDDPSSDLIRMKIWGPSGVVYDTQPGEPDTASPSMAIGGGSIVVHQ